MIDTPKRYHILCYDRLGGAALSIYETNWLWMAKVLLWLTPHNSENKSAIYERVGTHGDYHWNYIQGK